MTIEHNHTILLFALLGLALTGCPGPAGPAGETGPQGDAGTACWDLNGNGEGDPDSEDLNGDGSVDIYDCQGLANDGSDGEDGEDWSPPSMVGAAACADCHPEAYEAWLRSGHANALAATAGAQPTEPWAGLDDLGSYSAAPPAGYDWSEIRYVVGGWARSQVFVDADGWVITGEDSAWAQQHDAWIAYEPDQAPGSLPFDCATCHATGYRPEGNQDGMAGAVGTWQADGVQCERCHGNGGQHIEDPYDVPMAIDRSAELCGSCHVRGSTDSIQAADGYVLDGQQWTELFHGKKHVMDCTDCHDPHQSAHYEHDQNPALGMQVPCESCHFQQEAQQGSTIMKGFAGCTGCHMPDTVVVAQADHAWRGDHPGHTFAINVDIDADQTAGATGNPWVSLGFACRSCHSAGGGWTNYTDAQLLDEAVGYHD